MEFLRPYMSLVLGEKGYIIGEVASSATIPVRRMDRLPHPGQGTWKKLTELLLSGRLR